jgi:hypothetical protein
VECGSYERLSLLSRKLGNHMICIGINAEAYGKKLDHDCTWGIYSHETTAIYTGVLDKLLLWRTFSGIQLNSWIPVAWLSSILLNISFNYTINRS